MPGIKLRSTAALPRPTVPLMLSSAETWRRLPLTRTSVWSGLRPRKRCRTERVRAVGNRWLREVEGRDQLVEDLVGLGLAGIAMLVGADDVDRNRAVGDRPVGRARAGNDDGLFVADGILALALTALAPEPAHSAVPADWSARRRESRARAQRRASKVSEWRYFMWSDPPVGRAFAAFESQAMSKQLGSKHLVWHCCRIAARVCCTLATTVGRCRAVDSMGPLP